uniref:Uncharacterized protein n=1 Tax=Arundo donax TaxID=35708 RepID=A0A0A9EX78_ARUDO
MLLSLWVHVIWLPLFHCVNLISLLLIPNCTRNIFARTFFSQLTVHTSSMFYILFRWVVFSHCLLPIHLVLFSAHIVKTLFCFTKLTIYTKLVKTDHPW